MNPRRVHELMLKNFPDFDASKLGWKNIADLSGVRERELIELLNEYIHAEQALIEVNRKVGNFLPLGEIVNFAAPYIGKQQIKITDRNFTGFVVIASNGAAAGWGSNRS
ncbi:MAG: hypothetical protein HYZ18_01065 [Pseudogulbenkiania sp.]|nr:hypothetical protein [Pseudogulbenkiania sp.]